MVSRALYGQQKKYPNPAIDGQKLAYFSGALPKLVAVLTSNFQP